MQGAHKPRPVGLAPTSAQEYEIRRNLATAPSIAEAFFRLYMLEWACTTPVRTLAMGVPLRNAGPDIVERTSHFFANEAKSWGFMNDDCRGLPWAALLRKLDRINPGYGE